MIAFLFGEDVHRSHEKLLLLKKQFFNIHPNADFFLFDFSQSEEKEDRVATLEQAVLSGGLFENFRFISVKRIFSSDARNVELVKGFLETHGVDIIGSERVALIFWDEKVDRRSKLCKLLIKIAGKKAIDFVPLKGSQLDEWVHKKALSFDVSFLPDSLARFREMCADNSERMSREIEKLSLYCNVGPCSVADVEAVVSDGYKTSIFALLDAAGCGDKKAAMSLLSRQLSKGADPLYLLSMYLYHIRIMIRVGTLVSSGVADYVAIASQAKVHPFVAQKITKQLRSFSFERAIRALRFIARLDVAIKTGKIEPTVAITQLVVKM